MRHIKTFILRLYTGRDLPEKTCGDLQSLSKRKPLPFKNDAELLDLLHRLTKQETKNLPLSASQDESEPHLPGSNQPDE
jgi:hypothetical protein